MKKAFNFLLQKNVKILLKRIIAVNAVFIVVILLLNIFIDFEELHKRFSFSEVLEYQTTVIIGLFLLEIIMLIVVVGQWFHSRNMDIDSVNKLIRQGENENIEFKSSFRWDYKRNNINKDLEFTVVKGISGFMNAKGGTILIGVEDERNILGLGRDYDTLKKKNSDGFLIHLTHIINNYLGREFSAFWSANIIHNQGIDICRIDIVPADRPVYVKYGNKEEFFVRMSATTQPMRIKEAHEYIKTHWKS